MTVATQDITIRKEGDEFFLVGQWPQVAEMAGEFFVNFNPKIMRVILEIKLANGRRSYEVVGKMEHRDTVIIRRIEGDGNE